jgi:hypothetical protein
MNTSTVLAEAFAHAGYRPPITHRERLRAMMRDAIRAGSGKGAASRDWFVAALVREEDPALLWELFAEVRGSVIAALFTETISEMRAADDAKRERDAGKASDAVPRGQAQFAEPATAPAAGAIIGVPQGRSPVAPAAGAQQPSRLRYEASERTARASVLRWFKISGKPIGDATGAEARAWLKHHQRDGRFVDLLCYSVPDEITIGAMIPEDEADRLYKLATDAGNA